MSLQDKKSRQGDPVYAENILSQALGAGQRQTSSVSSNTGKNFKADNILHSSLSHNLRSRRISNEGLSSNLTYKRSLTDYNHSNNDFDLPPFRTLDLHDDFYLYNEEDPQEDIFDKDQLRSELNRFLHDPFEKKNIRTNSTHGIEVDTQKSNNRPFNEINNPFSDGNLDDTQKENSFSHGIKKHIVDEGCIAGSRRYGYKLSNGFSNNNLIYLASVNEAAVPYNNVIRNAIDLIFGQ